MNLKRYIKTIFLLFVFTVSFAIRTKASVVSYEKQQKEFIIKSKSDSSQENSSNQLPAEENKEEKSDEKETDDENESEINGKHRHNSSELFVCYTLLNDDFNLFSQQENLVSTQFSCKLIGKESTPIYITIHNFRI